MPNSLPLIKYSLFLIRLCYLYSHVMMWGERIHILYTGVISLYRKLGLLHCEALAIISPYSHVQIFDRFGYFNILDALSPDIHFGSREQMNPL
jgi:hypothetical protein